MGFGSNETSFLFRGTEGPRGSVEEEGANIRFQGPDATSALQETVCPLLTMCPIRPEFAHNIVARARKQKNVTKRYKILDFDLIQTTTPSYR